MRVKREVGKVEVVVQIVMKKKKKVESSGKSH